ncbi:DUF3817 domain-containing protein [Streptomyces sp. LX-29]|uniref:DUF3817 domain-containing protein n=1 Tax=Streptomyces sp. LX-29 TaxID=2900152 RepID=UPI00240E6165|nr:DUF3817 domain-containing protein [Streptomyces sp. LX-29]WFB10166.1 DUF3817 domain-containing protein [Streptomyces sp. LX-29]
MDSAKAKLLLRVAAAIELLSLLVLLGNLATVHVPAVASVLGPTHGCAYLFVVIAAIQAGAQGRGRAKAFVPGVGGLLAVRHLDRS